MSYLGAHPIQTDRSFTGLVQANDVLELKRNGAYPSSDWDCVYANAYGTNDANVGYEYIYSLPTAYDVFYFVWGCVNFVPTGTQSNGALGFQFSEDNGSTFITSGYAHERLWGDQNSTGINTSGGTSASFISPAFSWGIYSGPQMANLQGYIFNANTNKPTMVKGTNAQRDTNGLGFYVDWVGTYNSTNVTTDIKFMNNKLGAAGSEMYCEITIWGYKHRAK
jgi:hypothetical protein